VDSNTFGLLLAALATGLFIVWLVSRRKPERRLIATAAAAGLIAILVGLVVLLVWPIVSGGPLLD
jgi:uncharacterized membrane protein